MRSEAFLSEATDSFEGFDPDTVEAMALAYNDAAETLAIVEGVGGTNSRRAALARCIVQLAGLGERDPYRLGRLAIRRMREMAEAEAA